VQSQELLPKGEVLQDEFFSGAKDGGDPAEQMSKARRHQVIIAKSAPGRPPQVIDSAEILRTRRVLARHRCRNYAWLAIFFLLMTEMSYQAGFAQSWRPRGQTNREHDRHASEQPVSCSQLSLAGLSSLTGARHDVSGRP
jgi:hypothetical protein